MHCHLCGQPATYVVRKGDTTTGDKLVICGSCLWRDRSKWSVSLVVRGTDGAAHEAEVARAAFFEDRERRKAHTYNPVSPRDKANKVRDERRMRDRKAFANPSR